MTQADRAILKPFFMAIEGLLPEGGGSKCLRCWRVLREVEGGLCGRCADFFISRYDAQWN